ncbi:MAG: DUF1638 domain-containing protein, partial [Anaerolineales bacterium]
MTPSNPPSFKEHCIVSCGMLQPEINHLKETGFLDPKRIFFTAPGLHALPNRLEAFLLKRLAQAREICPNRNVIVVYGKKCFVSTDEPLKRVDTILQEVSPEIVRVQGEYGYDMLAGLEDRQRISENRQDKILWFTPGWLKSWKAVFQHYFGWDKADANSNFPGFYDKIIVMDTLDMGDAYMAEHADLVLELFDWTGLGVEFEPVSLDRFKELMLDALTASQ